MRQHQWHDRAVSLMLALAFCISLVKIAAAAQQHKVKIFVLIGQSNMYGRGSVENLLELRESRPSEFAYLFDFFTPGGGEYTMKSRSDVRIVSSQKVATGDTTSQSSSIPNNLAVGAGQRDPYDFGPEVGFGWTVGDEYDDPILLVKCAIGGSHLGVEWRSPSAPPGTYRDGQGNLYQGDDYGSWWRYMITMVNDAIANLENYLPGYDSTNDGYEIAGILWMQGWNDASDNVMSGDYEVNLSYFVQDLLDTFGVDVPILIAELGQQGSNPTDSTVRTVRQAQIDVVNQFEQRNVVFVPTSPYLVITPEPHWDGGHHYYGRADTILNIGNAFGREIIRQLLPPSTPPTMVPSIPPSRLPSTSPSNETSLNPSSTPTTLGPSALPSLNPSSAPSQTPSGTPTTAGPSSLPSNLPSQTPTTGAPSISAPPSQIPTRSDRPTGSSFPSQAPSIRPSSVPSGSFVPTTSPSVPPCTATGDSCSSADECCSERCHLVDDSNSKQAAGQCWDQAIPKSVVKLGFDRGGVGGRSD